MLTLTERVDEAGNEVWSLWDYIISQFLVPVSSAEKKMCMYRKSPMSSESSNAFAQNGSNNLVLVPLSPSLLRLLSSVLALCTWALSPF